MKPHYDAGPLSAPGLCELRWVVVIILYLGGPNSSTLQSFSVGAIGFFGGLGGYTRHVICQSLMCEGKGATSRPN